MVAVPPAGYGPACMADHRARRIRVRRAFLILPIALLTTVVSVTLHPAAAAAPTPTARPAAPAMMSPDTTSTRSSRYFRILNEAPTLLLIAIVILAVVKPF